MSDRVIECPCGVVLTGSSTDEVITQAQQHASDVHQMELSDGAARSMERPA